MDTESPDRGVSSTATHSSPHSQLSTAGVAVLAFALGGMTVAAVPLAMSWMDAEPDISSMVRIAPKQSLLAAQPSFEEAHREQVREIKIHQELIRTDRVLKLALASLELGKIEWLKRQSDPVNWLREHLQLDVSGDTPFIRLSIRGVKPEEQVVLVNAVTNSFLRAFDEYQEGSNARQRRAIEEFLNWSREGLARGRKSLIESESEGDGVEAAALRDEIAVKQEVFKRLMTAFEEMKLQRDVWRQRVDLVHPAELPKAK